MKWIAVSGDAYAIGYQLGLQARPAFNNTLVRIHRYREVLECWQASERIGQLQAAARSVFPQYMRELEGIADGAGMPFETVFAWNCRGDFPGGGEQTALAGCTDVMGWAPTRALAAMAHNEDDQPELEGECFIASVRPAHGRAFVSFYSPGLLPGHTFGWNDAGLVQTINHLRTHDQAVGVPRHFLCRAILDCADIDSAVALITATDRAGGFHHNLGACADAPRLVSVEAPASGVAINEVTHTHAHANHLVDPRLEGVPQTVAPSSSARQARAAELVRSGNLDFESGLRALADGHNSQWPIRRKRRGSNDPGYTLASAAFELGMHTLQWGVYTDPANQPLFSGRVRFGGAARP